MKSAQWTRLCFKMMEQLFLLQFLSAVVGKYLCGLGLMDHVSLFLTSLTFSVLLQSALPALCTHRRWTSSQHIATVHTGVKLWVLLFKAMFGSLVEFRIKLSEFEQLMGTSHVFVVMN